MRNGCGTTRIITVALMAACLFGLIGAGTIEAATSAKAGPIKTAKTVPTPQTLPMLIDVGADKCIPCKMMAPILEDLKKEYTGILEVKFVDVWKYPEEADKYRVTGIPTQIFYDASGKELGRHMGFIDREGILKGFEHFGVTIGKPSAKQANSAR